MLRSVCGTAAVAMALCLGCTGMLAQNSHYDYFGSPDPHDAWSPKIAGWQRRERASDGTALDAVPPVAGPGAVNGAGHDGSDRGTQGSPANQVRQLPG